MSSQSPQPHVLSQRQVMLLAAATGLIVASNYYAQPLLQLLGDAFGLGAGRVGWVVTVAQLSYAAGLLLIVPLGDLVETRRLVLAVMALGALSLAAAAVASSPIPFLAAALCIGLGSVSVQILVPYAAHLAPEAQRGRVVGNVMSGLMLGIMLARPVSSLIAAAVSWHAVFVFSFLAMLALGFVLYRALPPRPPIVTLPYGALLASMGTLVATQPVLRRRSLYQAGMFGAFGLFWTAAPLHLAQGYGVGQVGIALFALAGVAGAIAAPIAGRIADRGWTRWGTALAMLAVILSFLITLPAAPDAKVGIGLLVIAGIVLDYGVTTNVVLGQRAIYNLGDAFRSRLNGIYMATFFAGGAVGSALGAWAYARGGWPWTAWVGLALPAAALAFFATERRGATSTP